MKSKKSMPKDKIKPIKNVPKTRSKSKEPMKKLKSRQETFYRIY